ncbi:MAG: hypothetical protein ACR2F0_06155 [Chthoniobacterales bacterium]
MKEIESAAEALTVPEQRELLARLQTNLARSASVPADREGWLRELDELRARTKPGTSVVETLDEIRADRF